MHDDQWLIVDTETDGLYLPIHVVEIAGQKMRGWVPDGDPFRVLLNHDVPIDPMAEAVHGYSREYLRKNGIDPIKAHELFYAYSRNLPIVAYNLSFDWDRALFPEYDRLHLPTAGSKGFCALTLARRTIPEADNYKLETLKLLFAIKTGASHRGRNDVATLLEMLTRIIRPRLATAGIEGFDTIKEFSRKTPVAKCLELIRQGITEKPEWYVLTEDDKHVGPYTVKQIKGMVGDQVCFAWRAGMAEWTSSDHLPEFAPDAPKKRKRTAKRSKREIVLPVAAREYRPAVESIKKEVAELAGICKGIMSDGLINAQEFMLLRDWLTSCQYPNIYPMNVISDKIEAISEDGLFTSKEHEELMAFLQDKLLAYNEAPGSGLKSADAGGSNADTAQNTGTGSTHPNVDGKLDFVTINLQQGSIEWLKWRKEGIGASDAAKIMGENPWESAEQLMREKIEMVLHRETNAAMERGTALEPLARKAYIAQTGKAVFPACLQHRQYSWMRASVDGISEKHDHVIEIKCGNSSYRDACGGRVPDYYYAQLQHILQVTGLQQIDYWAFNDHAGGILITVARDDKYIERLFREEEKFWRTVSEMNRP